MRGRRRDLWLGLAGIAVAATALACGGTASPRPTSATGAEPAPADPRTSERQTTTATAGTTAGASTLRLVRVASGLSSPVHLAQPPGSDARLYVVEQSGRIRIVAGGRVRGTFLDIRSLVRSGGEQGLLSVAFHPDYSSNRLFYVNYTDLNGDTRVAEYRAGDGAPVRTRMLLEVDQPYANHNGGQLAFGPDGRLYVGMGDGGSGGDPENRAQDMSSRLGKLLRLDVDDPNADWEIVGLGLRNPWRFSFDRANGDLYIGDVGQNAVEEIDYVARSDGGLKNYGWDVFEGTRPYEDKPLNEAGELVRPIFEYGHSQGCSVTGGYVYRGKKVASARGRYFFGDYCSGRIWSLVVRGGKATNVKRHSFTVPQLTSFGENAAGELFLLSGNGTIYRLARG